MLSNSEEVSNKPIKFGKLLPNIITLCSLCFGLSSIRFALDEKWEQAVTCIIIASILDAVDGRVARYLDASSLFGAELDALCDFANFGIAPSLVIYLWAYHDCNYKLLSWGGVLLFASCMALRLARFNTNDPLKNHNQAFLVGIPAPAGALLILLPLVFEFDLAAILNFSFKPFPLILALNQILVALLMASRVPTISLKNITITQQYLWLWLFLSATLMIATFLYSWIVASLIGVLYILHIPFILIMNKNLKETN